MKNSPMTLTEIQTAAPSIFANNPFPGVSNRYAFIPTANVVEAMMSEGWGVRQASQSFTRRDDHKGYQKHMIRFTRMSDLDKLAQIQNDGRHVVNYQNPLAEMVEVVLTNSHDGTSTYQLHAGIFRLVCSNGLVVADATFNAMRVRHTGDANEIVGASYEILEGAGNIMGAVDAMKQVELTPAEQSQFALGGAMARYGFNTLAECPVDFPRLLQTNRREDASPTLWNTYNTVQENLMKGGQYIRKTSNVRTKAIRAVDASIKVNKSLWEMAGALLAAKE